MKASQDAVPDARRRRARRHRDHLPAGTRIADWALILLLMLLLITGMVLFAGVRFYVAGPLLLIVFLVSAMSLARILFRRGPVEMRAPPGIAGLTLFGMYLFAMIPRAVIPHEALVEGLVYVGHVAAYWAWTELSAVRGRWRWLVGAALLLSMCLAWYALYQHAHGSNMVLWVERPEGYHMRASGTHICPNHFAQVLAGTIVLGAATAATSSAGSFLRILGAYVALLCSPVLLLTASRSGWLAVLAGLGTLVLLLAARKGWRRFLVVLPVLLLVVGGAFAVLWTGSPLFKQRVQQAIKGDARPAIWKDTLSMIAAEPVAGHGGASYRWKSPSFQKAYVNADRYVRYAHNEYLHFASDYGIIGVVLLFAALITFVTRLLMVLARARDHKSVVLAAGLLGLTASVAAHAFFDFNLHIFANVQLLAMMAGGMAGALYVSGDLKPVTLRGGPARAAAVVMLGALLVMAAACARATASRAWATRSEKARTKLDFDAALTYARKAQQWEAYDWRGAVQEAHVLKTRAFWERDEDRSRELAGQAVARYEHALELNPLDLYTKMELSRALGDLLGDADGSVKLLEEIIALSPVNFEFHAELGLRYRRMGELEKAFRAFSKAWKIHKDDEMVNLNVRAIRKKLREGKTAPN